MAARVCFLRIRLVFNFMAAMICSKKMYYYLIVWRYDSSAGTFFGQERNNLTTPCQRLVSFAPNFLELQSSSYRRSSSNIGNGVVKPASTLVIQDQQFMVFSAARYNGHSKITWLRLDAMRHIHRLMSKQVPVCP